MEFKKYPSIENHYREQSINRWFKNFPELEVEKFIVTEKIHGANFQIIITEDDVRYASRNKFLKDGEKFYNYIEAVAECEPLIEALANYRKLIGYKEIRIYGELFGDGVQKGVQYQESNLFRAFDMMVDGQFCTQSRFVTLMDDLDLMDYVVPILGVGTFDECMEYDIKFDSHLSRKEYNICEGIVIKPLTMNIEDENGSRFYIKKKNEDFLEKKSVKKESKPVDDELVEAQEEFNSYITDNRVQNVFSKEGKIGSPKEIGKYIKLVITDAKEDFFKDNMDKFMKLSDSNKGKVFSRAGNIVAGLLKEYL